MAFEHLLLFREMELDADTDDYATVDVLVDTPGHDITAKFSAGFNTEATTRGRRTVNMRFPAILRGQLFQVKVSGTGVVRLYGARVYGKVVGTAEPRAWQWYPLPVEPTLEGYATAKLPIVPTPEGWAAAALPIVPTPEGWGSAGLPIAPTPEGWGAARLPIAPTPEGWGSAQLPLIPMPLEWVWVELPVDSIP